MVALGDMYASGLGVEQDNDTALSYYGKAAKEKNAGAWVGMGLLYKRGQGVDKSAKKAYDLFYKASSPRMPKLKCIEWMKTCAASQADVAQSTAANERRTPTFNWI